VRACTCQHHIYQPQIEPQRWEKPVKMKKLPAAGFFCLRN